MEDDHVCFLSLPDNPNYYLFGVFDGHCGTSELTSGWMVSRKVAENIGRVLVQQTAFKEGNYRAALKGAFAELDELVSQESSGSTAVVALITPEHKLFVANVGDSRIIIKRKDGVSQISIDHKPTDEKEYNRIKAAGSFVSLGRVQGSLALSRAFGDHQYKGNKDLPFELQAITCKHALMCLIPGNPDIFELDLGEGDEYLFLACDGIWDCLSNESVVEYIKRYLEEGKPIENVLEDMMDSCIAKEMSEEPGGDNMSAILVGILNGGGIDEWMQRIRSS